MMRCAGCGKPIGQIHQGTPLFRGQPMCDECYSGVDSNVEVPSLKKASVNHHGRFTVVVPKHIIDICDDMGVAESGAIFNIVNYLNRFRDESKPPAERINDLLIASWYMNWLVEKHTPPTKEVKDEQASHS